jgi:hypothetical protein
MKQMIQQREQRNVIVNQKTNDSTKGTKKCENEPAIYNME